MIGLCMPCGGGCVVLAQMEIKMKTTTQSGDSLGWSSKSKHFPSQNVEGLSDFLTQRINKKVC